MSGRPVRLAIASRDHVVATGLQRMLAEHAHRVVVVEGADDGAEVVLHDGTEPPDGFAGDGRPVGWVPLSLGVEQIVALIEAAATAGVVEEPAEALSAREEQVIALIAEGLTNQEIADRMFVSINSVKTYIRSAYRKMGVNSRSQAVVWGLRHGVVNPGRAADRGAR
jgi:DNA-binding NarL/FixJ family response regulator